MRERCRWLLVDLGRIAKPRHCAVHQHYEHPYRCFDDTGLLDCCCGLDKVRRPVPVLTEAVA